MTQRSSAAYWTRPEHRAPAPEPCWRRGCENDAAAVQDDRFRGVYCEPCQSAIRLDSEAIKAALER